MLYYCYYHYHINFVVLSNGGIWTSPVRIPSRGLRISKVFSFNPVLSSAAVLAVLSIPVLSWWFHKLFDCCYYYLLLFLICFLILFTINIISIINTIVIIILSLLLLLLLFLFIFLLPEAYTAFLVLVDHISSVLK